VESGVKYVKNNFMPLREFRDLPDANAQLMDWVMQDAGNRIHGTTRTPPLKRFVETEQAMLAPLPNSAPECARWATAKLHGDCHVQVEKCRYSAPWRLVGNDLAQCRFIEEKVPVLIAGPCGTGKSHIAQAIGHCAVRLGYDVMFISQSSLLAQINAARATGAIERKMQALIRVPLIIIDDFGLKPLKPGQDEDFHNLVAERYERAATIITSNLDFT